MKLDKIALGLTLGILWGFGVLAATLIAMWRGGGGHLYLLRQFYLGYSVSVSGALIGFFWAFVDGFVGGWIFAWLYNKFTRN